MAEHETVEIEEEEVIQYPAECEGLQLLSSMEEWEFAEGEPDIRGWMVFTDDGTEAGTVDDLLVDVDSGQGLFLIVSRNEQLGGEKTAVPTDLLDIDEDDKRITFLGDADEIRESPVFAAEAMNYEQLCDYWDIGAPMEEQDTDIVAGADEEDES